MSVIKWFEVIITKKHPQYDGQADGSAFYQSLDYISTQF